MIQRVCVLVTIVEVLLSTSAIGQDQAKKVSEFTSANPFFSEYATPFQTPPFDLIKNEWQHFEVPE